MDSLNSSKPPPPMPTLYTPGSLEGQAVVKAYEAKFGQNSLRPETFKFACNMRALDGLYQSLDKAVSSSTPFDSNAFAQELAAP